MDHWKIGILGAADIAYRRFLPALEKSEGFSFAGIAARNPARCAPFLERFGGRCYPDYLSLLADPEIRCVYLPLPPALHMPWGMRVLEAGKHLLIEKPFTTSATDTAALLQEAERRGLAVHENYMFLYHRQLDAVRQIMASGELGELRMLRAAFTFPHRGGQDFRYNPELGGGALLDCGGYPLRLALELLGKTARLCWSDLRTDPVQRVDTAGSAVLQNDSGLTAHLFFGMDDTYRCELEVWGSRASLTAPRIFTAPPDLDPILQLRGNGENRDIPVNADDQFLKSIIYFGELLAHPELRPKHYGAILRQSELVQSIRDWKKQEASL